VSIRTAAFFVAGLLVGVALESGLAQERPITGLNHVALSVENFDAASKFYAETMGLKEAFAFREADGTPYLTYFQINRDTFIELMPATASRPAGFVHVGLEVANLDATVKRLRAGGMQVRDPSVSPRTKTRIAVATTPQGTSMELLEIGPESLHRKVMNAWK
jgi:catechol 2,3-dioxygenase-like lactoylglutathione lyase family enzyme